MFRTPLNDQIDKNLLDTDYRLSHCTSLVPAQQFPILESLTMIIRRVTPPLLSWTTLLSTVFQPFPSPSRFLSLLPTQAGYERTAPRLGAVTRELKLCWCQRVLLWWLLGRCTDIVDTIFLNSVQLLSRQTRYGFSLIKVEAARFQSSHHRPIKI